MKTPFTPLFKTLVEIAHSSDFTKDCLEVEKLKWEEERKQRNEHLRQRALKTKGEQS